MTAAARFTPQMYIDYYIHRQGLTIEELGVAPLMVISWSPRVIDRFAERTGAQPAPNWPWSERYRFYSGQVGGQRVSFAQVGIGAPATITAMEEMIPCGARLFLGLGWAGSLQPAAPIGAYLVPTTCLREEGTSPHYTSDEQRLIPDPELAEQLTTTAHQTGLKVIQGRHWTTDAPYRELVDKITTYRAAGILGVDMETSAMYALGQFRQVRVCNLLVVSDELWQDWKPAFRTPELRAATDQAMNVVLQVLEAGLQ